jgi:hypothetical protein
MARCFVAADHRCGRSRRSGRRRWRGLFHGAKKPSVAGQDYAALAARMIEIEKRLGSSKFDIDAIKSFESTLARRVDQVEAALSHLED